MPRLFFNFRAKVDVRHETPIFVGLKNRIAKLERCPIRWRRHSVSSRSQQLRSMSSLSLRCKIDLDGESRKGCKPFNLANNGRVEQSGSSSDSLSGGREFKSSPCNHILAQLSRSERYVDIVKVGGSSPLVSTSRLQGVRNKPVVREWRY